MNLQRVNEAIAIMERVKARGDKLDMRHWQGYQSELCTTEEELHACGTAACFAGYVSVSSEFKSAGGDFGPYCGMPMFDLGDGDGDGVAEGVDAIEAWLDIDSTEARLLCGVTPYGMNLSSSLCLAYPIQVSQYDDLGEALLAITVDDVLAALCRLRDTGSVRIPVVEISQ